MFSRVIPSWEQIDQFKQPLTEGERHLIKFLDENLKKDDFFQGDDLAKYNGWLIFVQPFLNGSRPDIIIFNPNVGVQIFEVKDWNLKNYSFGTQGNSRGIHAKKSPVQQVEYYKEKIYSLLVPQIGECIDNNSQSYGLIKTGVYFHKSTTVEAQGLFQHEVRDFTKFPVIGYDRLSKDYLTDVVPDSQIRQSRYWQKDWNKGLLFWLNPPFHSMDQGVPLTLTNEQKKFAEPKLGHYRVRGVAGSGKTQIIAYRASKLVSQGYRVLILTFNLTLVHLIHDMVQKSPFNFSWHNLTITYFHGFCKDILNEFGEKWPIAEDDENLFIEVVSQKVIETLRSNRYDGSILTCV